MTTDLRKPAGYTLAVLLMAAAMLHAYWALGGTWFLVTALNMEVTELPPVLLWMTWGLVVALLVGTLLALLRAEIVALPIPSWIVATCLWIFTALALLGAVFNALIPRFWDRWVFAPIFVVLAILGLILAVPKRETE